MRNGRTKVDIQALLFAAAHATFIPLKKESQMKVYDTLLNHARAHGESLKFEQDCVADFDLAVSTALMGFTRALARVGLAREGFVPDPFTLNYVSAITYGRFLATPEEIPAVALIAPPAAG